MNIHKAAKNNKTKQPCFHNYSLYKTHYWYLMWLPGLSRKPKSVQHSLCWWKVLDVHWRMAKDPSSHMCLVQHKICVGGRERGRKVYLLYWRQEVTAVSRENTLLMMETLKSIVSIVSMHYFWLHWHHICTVWEVQKRFSSLNPGIDQ